MTKEHGAAALRAQEVNVHELKTLAQYWDAVACGAKNFEVRRDDRGFQRGDLLKLHRVDQDDPTRYSTKYGTRFERRTLVKRITYVLTGGHFGIEAGYVVLGLVDDEPRGLSASEGSTKPEAVNTDSPTRE